MMVVVYGARVASFVYIPIFGASVAECYCSMPTTTMPIFAGISKLATMFTSSELAFAQQFMFNANKGNNSKDPQVLMSVMMALNLL